MSKNDKIRKIAEKLPDVPKLHKGKIQHDNNGNIIYLNHFREIKQIYESYNGNTEDINDACARYVEFCLAYKKRMDEISKKVKRDKVINLLAIIGLIAILLACLVKLGLKIF